MSENFNNFEQFLEELFLKYVKTKTKNSCVKASVNQNCVIYIQYMLFCKSQITVN